jgi:phage gpG-like protein
MTDRFTVVVQDTELNAALSRATAKLDEGRLLGQIGALLESRVNQRFDRKVDPNALAWKPLSENTLALYARADGDSRRGTLLERTGRMRQSLAHNVIGDAVEVGFAVPYAQYHETGTRTKTGKVKMPRRGMLTADWEAGTLGDGDRRAILQLLGRYLGELFE